MTYNIIAGQIQEGGKMSELRSEIICSSKSSHIMEDRVYEITLQFVLIKAVYDIFKNSKLIIEHSLGRGVFGEISKNTPLNELDVMKIKNRMKEIIDKDIPINKIKVSKNEAIDIFTKYNMMDKVNLLNNLDVNYLYLYELDGIYDYFYGNTAESTGKVQLFDLYIIIQDFCLYILMETIVWPYQSLRTIKNLIIYFEKQNNGLICLEYPIQVV